MNVLVAPDGNPLLIDFAEVGIAPACLDPTTLELSVLFHPESPFGGGTWPEIDQGDSWTDLNGYVSECPIEGFVRLCREWAVETAGSREAFLAVAYAHSMRQLKFEDTDKPLAAAIAKSCARELADMFS